MKSALAKIVDLLEAGRPAPRRLGQPRWLLERGRSKSLEAINQDELGAASSAFGMAGFAR